MGMGGSDKAAKQAQAEEDARQAAIKNSQAGINAAFDNPNRKREIADFVAAMREKLGGELSQQKADNDRSMKFALARGGLTGGSTNIDQQKRAGETYQKGLLDVESKALGAGADLESADQDARMRLISMATQGLDATTAAQQSAAGMRTALQAGKSATIANGLGDVFSAYKSEYQKAAEAAVRRRADQQAYGLYKPSGTIFGGTP